MGKTEQPSLHVGLRSLSDEQLSTITSAGDKMAGNRSTEAPRIPRTRGQRNDIAALALVAVFVLLCLSMIANGICGVLQLAGVLS